MRSNDWSVGDWVIYRKLKRSTSPGSRARNVVPATRGESYAYTVDKYWIVTEIREDGRLIVKTFRGKQHEIAPDDSMLRKPRWWERWVLRGRFQKVEKSLDSTG